MEYIIEFLEAEKQEELDAFKGAEWPAADHKHYGDNPYTSPTKNAPW